MRQILQDLSSGETQIMELPRPSLKGGHVLIRSSVSLISPGTERMLVEFGKSTVLGKARQQPEKVAEVLGKIKTDGLASTVTAVRNKLSQPIPLGYCNAGTVIDLAPGVQGLKVGQRVLSNGHHAETVLVPKNLCVPIPDAVTDDEAVFGVLGAIALQGMRLAKTEVGECVVVMGLGTIGLMAVQLLKAQGCRVLGIDMDAARTALAKQFGADVVNLNEDDNPETVARAFSRGRGVDAVLITAATKSSEPVKLAANMCRKRGRIVLVGVAGLALSRDDFYQKELSFQVSCSYGPGRYDPQYEQGGQDYPVGFVRFTEQRNFETVLDLMESRALSVTPLISHKIDFEDALSAYDSLTEDRSALGIILQYSSDVNADTTIEYNPSVFQQDTASVAFIGAGNYAGSILIPAFCQAGASMNTVAARSSVKLGSLVEQYGFSKASTDVASAIFSDDINTVVIATQHDSHAHLVCESLVAGKHVFVEKPLAMNEDELVQIESYYERVGVDHHLMVGFNRRFAPHVVKMKALLETLAREPKAITITINAGYIDQEHWTQNKATGGGRIIGEMCHFIDLARFIVGHAIVGVQSVGMRGGGDTVSSVLQFQDGSIATIQYFANGNKRMPKERVEVFCASHYLCLDNYRKLTGLGFKGFSKIKSFKQDKGQNACAQAFVEAVKSGSATPIPFSELTEVTRATFTVVRQCVE